MAVTEQEIDLPHLFEPWPHQEEVFTDFYDRGIRRFLDCWHRRSGKDKTWINLIVDQMTRRVGNYCHVLPQRTRARLVIWEAIDAETGMRLIDHFPQELIYRKLEQEMLISFVHPKDTSKEGSIYRAMGSDKDEHLLVGSNPIGVVWSEYPEINPRLRTLTLPILRRNKGWEALCYTPRGGRQNHGCRLFFQVRNDPDWHVRYLTTKDTVDHEGKPLVTDADIEADKRAGMSQEEVDQEYFLSWDSPMPGAYYAAEMRQAEKDGRIRRVDYDPSLPTYTAWDLGNNDVNAIWWFQPAGREVRFIDYAEESSVALVPDPQHPENPSWIQVIRTKSYCYDHSLLPQPLTAHKHEIHYGPHDLAVHEYSTNKTRYGHALEHGLRFTVLPHPGPGGLADGISTARRLLGRAVFDAERCQQGLDALRNYRRERDEKTQTFREHPAHTWASNGCLAEDTCIDTARGSIAIADVVAGDVVRTPNGYQHVEWSGRTKIATVLYAITLHDGRVLYVTPSHKFFTARGLVYADTLRYDDILLSGMEDICISASWISRVSGIGFRESITDIINGLPIIPQRCTERSGKLIMGLSLMDIISTIAMATPSIMTLPIWNAFPLQSIRDIIPTIPTHGYEAKAMLNTCAHLLSVAHGSEVTRTSNSCEPLGPWPRNGMPVMQAASGIENTAKHHGSVVYGSRVCAKSVDSLSYLPTPVEQNTAMTIVRLQRCENVAVPVHDLTVAHDHCYRANGVLVSNSDAFRYAAVGLLQPGEPLKPPVPPNSFAWARQQLKRAKLGLPPQTFKVGAR